MNSRCVEHNALETRCRIRHCDSGLALFYARSYPNMTTLQNNNNSTTPFNILIAVAVVLPIGLSCACPTSYSSFFSFYCMCWLLLLLLFFPRTRTNRFYRSNFYCVQFYRIFFHTEIESFDCVFIIYHSSFIYILKANVLIHVFNEQYNKHEGNKKKTQHKRCILSHVIINWNGNLFLRHDKQ